MNFPIDISLFLLSSQPGHLTDGNGIACNNHIWQRVAFIIFSLPLKNKSLVKRWVHVIARKNLPLNPHTRICSKHFVPRTSITWSKEETSKRSIYVFIQLATERACDGSGIWSWGSERGWRGTMKDMATQTEMNKEEVEELLTLPRWWNKGYFLHWLLFTLALCLSLLWKHVMILLEHLWIFEVFQEARGLWHWKGCREHASSSEIFATTWGVFMT